jgi:hypothetical protein
MNVNEILQLTINKLIEAESNVVTKVLEQVLKRDPEFKDYNKIQLIEFSHIPYTKRVLFDGVYIGIIEYDFENRMVNFTPTKNHSSPTLTAHHNSGQANEDSE